MSSTFDLEVNVVQRYTGEALLQRLVWIAFHCTDVALKTAAFKAALKHCMEQHNVARYKEIFHHPDTAALSASVATYDSHWVQEAENLNRHQRETLLSRLQNAQVSIHYTEVRK